MNRLIIGPRDKLRRLWPPTQPRVFTQPRSQAAARQPDSPGPSFHAHRSLLLPAARL